MKTEERKKLGAQMKKKGKEFEIRVGKDLTEKGWNVGRFDMELHYNKTNKE